MLVHFTWALASAHSSTFNNIIGNIDSTSGVLVNRSFAHAGIIDVMKVVHSGKLRYPGAPAVAGAFDPVRVTFVYYFLKD